MPRDMPLSIVHYLPIATTVLAAGFSVSLLRRAAARGWPAHLTWWGAGVATYGMGTLLESWITLAGNGPTLNRLWYWAGAVLGAYPLGTGSLYLLSRGRAAHAWTAATLALVVFASVCVFATPIDTSALLAHKPSGDVLEWRWVRLLTPFINGYAAVLLVGGAIVSSVRYFRIGGERRRATGTALIAVGALLPGIGGGMAKAGVVEALYVGELVGLVLIFWGNQMCAGGSSATAAIHE